MTFLFILLMVIIWIASVLIKLFYILDTEEIVKWQLGHDTGLVIPEKYTILESYGSVFSDSVKYTFQFQENEFEELKRNLLKTRFYNDTLALNEFQEGTWDPDDERKVYAMNGLWLETDTTFYFLRLSPNILHIEADIELAEINKNNKTLIVIPTILKADKYLDR